VRARAGSEPSEERDQERRAADQGRGGFPQPRGGCKPRLCGERPSRAGPAIQPPGGAGGALSGRSGGRRTAPGRQPRCGTP
jgi:hypothetical protein